ncbi:hypothetical protein PTI98_013479 [Pleurotus ostreatus]|nr:hypothetical protein PTI98_013479 [Pleurotus ostreatus]
MVQTVPFKAELGFITLAGAFDLLENLYTRFFPNEDIPIDLFNNVHDYLGSDGQFKHLKKMVEKVDQKAKQQNQSPHPIHVYNFMRNTKIATPPLVRLAEHILSICANSASCERLFSVLGNTLTKLRNRLSTKPLVELAKLKMHICDKYLRKSDIEKQTDRKHMFGIRPTSMSEKSEAPDPIWSGHIM